MSAAPEPSTHRTAAAQGYLPHVDGLRALAVLSVMLYHADVPFVTGGFSGVDVFFTISGFVIARLVIGEARAGTFRFGDFYARRIRRLLPALLPVLFATAAIGWFVMLPEDYAGLGRASIATMLFAANLHFWQGTDYFTSSTDTEPLVNMWSLGVEEQFYIFAPILFLVLLKFARGRLLLAGAVLATLVSLALSVLLLPRSPVATFYLLPTRAWEIMLGASLAIAAGSTLLPRSEGVRTALTGLGFALLAWSFFGLDSTYAFPGLAAVPACLGAALLIAGGSNALARPVLENRASIAIGLVSYAAYLWHWPLLALWRYRNYGDLALVEGLAILLLSLVLAAASYRWIEQPFRRGKWRKIPAPLLALAVAIPVISVGWALKANDGFPARVSEAAARVVIEMPPTARDNCVNGYPDPVAPADSCTFPAQVENASWAVWGDSHGYALVEAVGEALPEGESVRFLGSYGCPPMPGIRRPGALVDCAEQSGEVLDYLRDHDEIEVVLLIARHAAAIKGATDDFGPAEDDRLVPPVTLLPMQGAADAPLVTGYLDRFAATVRILREMGKQVVIVLPVPEVGYDVPRTLTLRAMRGLEPDSFTRPRSMYDERNGEFVAAARRIAADEDAMLVDPTRQLCNADNCATARGNVALYTDDDHLSWAGAKLLADAIVAAGNAAAENTDE